jgi:hypothetical protein
MTREERVQRLHEAADQVSAVLASLEERHLQALLQAAREQLLRCSRELSLAGRTALSGTTPRRRA